jgi:hypothetical protein
MNRSRAGARVLAPGRDLDAAWEAVALDRVRDGRVVHAEVRGNGADLPVLGVEEAMDLGALPGGDHAGGSHSRSCRMRKRDAFSRGLDLCDAEVHRTRSLTALPMVSGLVPRHRRASRDCTSA